MAEVCHGFCDLLALCFVDFPVPVYFHTSKYSAVFVPGYMKEKKAEAGFKVCVFFLRMELVEELS